MTWAEQRVTSGIAALLVASLPLWLVLIEALRREACLPPGRLPAGVILGSLLAQ